jgi:hypothetical protein
MLTSLAPVVYNCNPTDSGGREQEDHDLKPAWTNSSGDLISKIPDTKRARGMAQVVECLPNKCKALNATPPVLPNKKRGRI